jgi:hypothetical protein
MTLARNVRQTSIATYYAIREDGLLSRMRWLVYDCLYQHGPLTAQETFKQLGLESNQSGRFTEMRELGVILEVGERQCAVTGRNVILWDVTAALPSSAERTEPPRPSRAHFRAAADELRTVYRFLKQHDRDFSENMLRVARWMAAR